MITKEEIDKNRIIYADDKEIVSALNDINSSLKILSKQTSYWLKIISTVLALPDKYGRMDDFEYMLKKFNAIEKRSPKK